MKPLNIVLTAILTALALPRDAGAAEWSKPVTVSESCCDATAPFVLHDDAGAPHLWWVDSEGGSGTRSHLRHTKGSGDAFLPAQQISDGFDAKSIAGVQADGALYLVVGGYRDLLGKACGDAVKGGCWDVWYLESLDAGATWSTPQALPHPEDALNRREPALARGPDGALLVAYGREKTIYTMTRDPQGAWGEEVEAGGVAPGQEGHPQVVFTTSGPHLLFRGRPGDGYELLYARREADQWTTPTSITPLVGGAMFSALVSDGGQRLQAAFVADDQGDDVVFAIESLDDGASWSAPVRLSDGTLADEPSIARELGGQTTHVVWDYSGYIAQAEGDGQTFSKEQWISLGGGNNPMKAAHVSAGPDDVIVVWQAPSGFQKPRQIYLTRRAPTDPIPVDPTTGGESSGESSGQSDSDSDTDSGTDPSTGADPSTSANPTTGAATSLTEGTGTTPTTGGAPTSASTGAGQPDTGPGGEPGGADEGCGCTAPAGGAPWWLALALLRRRRRSA